MWVEAGGGHRGERQGGGVKEVRPDSEVDHAYRKETIRAGGSEESTGVTVQTGSWYPAPYCTSLGWDPPGV